MMVGSWIFARWHHRHHRRRDRDRRGLREFDLPRRGGSSRTPARAARPRIPSARTSPPATTVAADYWRGQAPAGSRRSPNPFYLGFATNRARASLRCSRSRPQRAQWTRNSSTAHFGRRSTAKTVGTGACGGCTGARLPRPPGSDQLTQPVPSMSATINLTARSRHSATWQADSSPAAAPGDATRNATWEAYEGAVPVKVPHRDRRARCSRWLRRTRSPRAST